MAGSGASSGLPVSLYEWTAGWLIVLLGELFAPVYLRAHVTTVPEFCERRFGPGTRILASALSLLACIVTKISASIFAGGILLRVVAGWDLWTSVPVIIVSTGVYTIGGGLQAVMYTDVLQAAIFLAGGFGGLVVSLQRTGGFAGLAHTLERAGLESHLHLIRPSSDVANPSSGIFTGLIISSVWYWCIDQVIVQRVLSARSLHHARAGCVAAGYAKLLPPLIIVVPGIAARVLFERCRMNGAGLGQPDGGWCTARLDEPDAANAAYPELIVREFPPGMVGLMISAMVCAMMSSLSSNFNSASTIFTVDIYHRFLRPHATERELLWCGRLATAFTCVLSLAWLPVVQRQRGEFYLVVQAASSHLAPALATVISLGIAWRRVNERAAFVGLAVGSLLGLVQYGVSLAYEAECRAAVVGTTIGGPPFACMHFLHMAVIICVVTLVVTVAFTLVGTPPPSSVTDSTTVLWKSCLVDDELSATPSPHVQMVDTDGAHDHHELGARPSTDSPMRTVRDWAAQLPESGTAGGLPPVETLGANAGAWGDPPTVTRVTSTRPGDGGRVGLSATQATSSSAAKHDNETAIAVSSTPRRAKGGCIDSRLGQLAVRSAGASLVVVVIALVVTFR